MCRCDLEAVRALLLHAVQLRPRALSYHDLRHRVGPIHAVREPRIRLDDGSTRPPLVRTKSDREAPRPHTTGQVYARREGRGVAPVHEDDAGARTDAQAIDV